MPILTPEETAKLSPQQLSYTSPNRDITQAIKDYDSQFSTGSRESAIGDIYPKTSSKYDLTVPYGEYNIEEWRAQQQSVGNRVLKTVPRILNTALSEVAKMPGYAVGLGMAATTDLNIGDALDNWWIRGIEEAKQYVDDEWLSVYIPEKVKNGNLLDNIGSASFWATEGADGVGFMLSFLTPGIALKAIGAGAKGVELLNMVSKASKLGDTGADLIRGGVKFGERAARNINDVSSVVVNATLESAAEASETYKNALRTYKDKGYSDEIANEMAGKAAAGSFNTNLLLLSATGALSQRQLFGAFRGRGDKGIIGELFDEQGNLIKGLGAKTFTQKLPKVGKELAKGILSEGFLEEGLQSAAQKYFQDKQLHPDDYDNAIEGLIGSYIKGLKDVDMQKSILLGSVLGSLQGGVSTYREIGEQDKQLFGSGAKSPSKVMQLLGARERESTKGVYKTLEGGLIEKLNLEGIKDLFVKEGDNYKLDANGRREVDENKLGEFIQKAENKDAALAIMAIAKEMGDTQTFNRYFLANKTGEFLQFLKEDNGLELLNKYIDSQLAQSEVDKYGDTFGLKVNEVKSSLKSYAKNLNDNYKALTDTHQATFKVPKGEDTQSWNEFNEKVFNNKLDAGLLVDQTIDANNKLKEEKSKILGKSEESRTPIDSIREKQLDRAIKANEDIIEESKKTLESLLDTKTLTEQFEAYKSAKNNLKEEIANQPKDVDNSLTDSLTSQGYTNLEQEVNPIYFDNGDNRLAAQRLPDGQWGVFSQEDLTTPIVDKTGEPTLFNEDYFNENKSKLRILSKEQYEQRVAQEAAKIKYNAEIAAAKELVKLSTTTYEANSSKITALQSYLSEVKGKLEKEISVSKAEEVIKELSDIIEATQNEINTLEEQNQVLATAIQFYNQVLGVEDFDINSMLESIESQKESLFSIEEANQVIEANKVTIEALTNTLTSLNNVKESLQKSIDKNKNIRSMLLAALNNNLLSAKEFNTAKEVTSALNALAKTLPASTAVAIGNYELREVVTFINNELRNIRGSRNLSPDAIISILEDRISSKETKLEETTTEIKNISKEIGRLQQAITNFNTVIDRIQFYNTYQPLITTWVKKANQLLADLSTVEVEQVSSSPEVKELSNEETLELAKKATSAKRIDPYTTGGRNFEYKDGYATIYPEVWDEEGYPTQTSDLDQQRWFKYLDSKPDIKNTFILFVSYRNLDSQNIPTGLKETIKNQLANKNVDSDNALFAVLVNSEGNPLVDAQGKYYYTSVNTTERLFDGDKPLILLDKVIRQELTDTAASGEESTVSKLFDNKTEGNELLTWQGLQVTKDELYDRLVAQKKTEIREAYNNWRLSIFNTIANKGAAYSTPLKVSKGIMVVHKTNRFLVKDSAKLTADSKNFANRGWKILIGKADNSVTTTGGNKVVSGRAIIETSDGTEIPINMPNLNEEQINTVVALLRYAISGNQAGLNKHIKLAGDKYTYVDGAKTNGTYPIFPNTREGNVKSANKNSLLTNIINWGRARRGITTPGEIYLDTPNREIVFVPLGIDSAPKRIKFDDLFNAESEGYQELRNFLATKRLNINESKLSKDNPVLYLQPKINGTNLAISKDGLETTTYSSYEEYLLEYMTTPLIPKNNSKGLPQFAQRHIVMGKEIKAELPTAKVVTASPVVSEQPTGVKTYSIVSKTIGSTTIYTVDNGKVDIISITSKDGTPIVDSTIFNKAKELIQKKIEVFIRDSKEIESNVGSELQEEADLPNPDEIDYFLDEDTQILDIGDVPKSLTPVADETTSSELTEDMFTMDTSKIDHSLFIIAYKALPDSRKQEYTQYLEESVWNNQSAEEQDKIIKCIKK